MPNTLKQIWETVADELREDIIRGVLTPGERLKVTEVAGRFGVSNTPVREAFRELAAEGFVEAVPRKMVIVKTVTPAEVRDIYDIQGALEGLAARRAAERAAPDDIARLRGFQALMETSLRSGDMEGFVAANRDFHQSFIGASGNGNLAALLGNLRDQVRRFRSIQFHSPGRPEESVGEHRLLLSAIERRDPEEAERLARVHIGRARDLLARHLAAESAAPLARPAAAPMKKGAP